MKGPKRQRQPGSRRARKARRARNRRDAAKLAYMVVRARQAMVRSGVRGFIIARRKPKFEVIIVASED